MLACPFVTVAQNAPGFYISNEGKDLYPGTSPILPKKTITATAPFLKKFSGINTPAKVSLQSGSLFKENLVTSYPIEVRTYPGEDGNNDFAILDGSEEFNTGWTKTGGTGYTYEQDIPYSGFSGYGINGIGSYSYIYVFEVDRSLEKTAPFTARRLLQFVTSTELLEKTPGSFYSPVNTTENPKKIAIHTTNGTSPNENAKYRYEVAVKDFAINSTYQENNSFENLWVRGFGAGIGSLPGGNNSHYNKIIFGPGAGIHHLVVRNGIIDHSLFLPGAKNTNEFAVVVYDVEGLNRHSIIRNSMFLDIPSPVYSHTSYGSNFGALEMDNVVGFADTSERGGFMFTSNTDSVLLKNVYADGYLCGYNYGKAKYAGISNCYFKDVTFGIAYSATNPVNASVDNVFIKTAGSAYTSGIYMQDNTTLQLSNSILHIKNAYTSYWPNAAAFVYNAGKPGSSVHASGNIFIADINPQATMVAASGNSKDKWDNNVYILLSGNKIAWYTTDPSVNNATILIDNFEEWKRRSGQDVHSLFFDLRNDPRGLQAIFTDPENGNYDLANTPEGRQVAALHAGMREPLTCFLHKPGYEEAAGMIRNNINYSINTCRNPCAQNTVRVNNTFTSGIINDHQVKLQWNIAEQQNVSYYVLQKATKNSVFRKVAIIPVGTDSLYSFVDEAEPGIPYQYRLQVTAHTGNTCYSEARAVKIPAIKPISIYPNPSHGLFKLIMNGYIGVVNYTVNNSNGKAILKGRSVSAYNPVVIDLSGQAKGVYFVKLEAGNSVYAAKLVVL
jgi:hypothetical protein